MVRFPVFLSIVFVLRNRETDLKPILENAVSNASSIVTEFEIVVVDNGSDDSSVGTLRELTREGGVPNVQVLALTEELDADTAAWVGLENALGDFVAVVDPLTEEVSFLATMLEPAVRGADVVFAYNLSKPLQSFAYRTGSFLFNYLYKLVGGVHLSRDMPQYRLLSKRLTNFILQHPTPLATYRRLPTSSTFSRVNLEYTAAPVRQEKKRLGASIDRGMRLLVSTTKAPMRIVTTLSLFGAVANLLYSAYVVVTYLVKPDVAAGWASLSLQQSGMFFLLSLVLLVLGEYILNMSSLANEGPGYHVGQEFSSEKMYAKHKLNVEETSGPEVTRIADQA